MTTDEKHRVMAIGLANMSTNARAVAIKAALDAARADGAREAKEACAVACDAHGWIEDVEYAKICRAVEVTQ